MSTETMPLRALIADDHAPTRQDVRRALEADKRFDVCAEVADAAEAVQAAVQDRPDVCLRDVRMLDVRMPGSGVAAAWEIGARLPQAKIVMLTVSDSDSDLFAALRAGADGYLLQTMDIRRLAARCTASAGTGAEAVTAALRERPDLCLLEVQMPGDGTAAAKAIRRELPGTKVILITATPDEEGVMAAARAGAVGYLAKDVNPHRLPEIVRAVTKGDTAYPRSLLGVLLRSLSQQEWYSWYSRRGRRQA